MSNSGINPTVTFIIPHRGRLDFLISTVNSIDSQDYSREQINILILTQDDPEAVRNATTHCKISIEVIKREHSETISSMRNFGSSRTSASYLAFIDADIVLSPNWTATMVYALNEESSRIIVSAPQCTSEKPTLVEKIRTTVGNSVGGVNVSSLPGHNLFLHSESFKEAGGFPADLATCEDYCFTVAMSQIGKLFIAPSCWYIHLGEDRSFSQLLKKEYWRAGSNIQSLRGRKVPLKEYPSILLPFWFLMCIATIITGLIKVSLSITSLGVLSYSLPIILYTFRITRRTVNLGWIYIFFFYFLYHSARSLGTITGMRFLFLRKTDK
jgi:hypothetical protein